MVQSLFEQQRAVLDDPHDRKAVRCPRRAGKSWTSMVYAITTAIRNPHATIPIVLLTRAQAENIFWKDLKSMCRLYGIEVNPHESKLQLRFANGSMIFLIGAENRGEVEKLRGGKYDLCIIDEAKSFAAHILFDLIENVVQPALDDKEGTLLLTGTPGHILSGPFYEATYPGYVKKVGDADIVQNVVFQGKQTDAPWSLHTWTRRDNTKTKGDLWARALAHKKRMGWSDDNPTWRREYLGEWAPAADAMVYRLTEVYHKHPERISFEMGGLDNHWGLDPDGEWHYIMGLDHGFEDDFALIVAAYSDKTKELIPVYEFKQNHLTISQVAEEIQYALDLFDGRIEAMVSDVGASKQLVESLNQEYGFYLEPAEKRDKEAYIELLNSDIWDGRVKMDFQSQLAFEMFHLQWEGIESEEDRENLIRRGKLREDPSCPNHLCDAFLYLWRYSYHRFEREKEIEYDPTNPIYKRKKKQEAVAEVTRRRREQRDAAEQFGLELGPQDTLFADEEYGWN